MIWSSAAWGDYDNDGKLDAMIMGYDPVAQVPVSRLYRNIGGNAFADSGQTFHNLYLGTLSWVDYDNDGNLDLLLAGNNAGADQLILYRNNNSAKNTVPGAPAGLVATNFGPNISFSWSAAADPQTPPAGLGYNLRVGTIAGCRGCPQPGVRHERDASSSGPGERGIAPHRTAQHPSPRHKLLLECAGHRHQFRGRAVCWPRARSFWLRPLHRNSSRFKPARTVFNFEASGAPGWTYGILGTTNLNAPDWARLGSGIADGFGKILFSDTNTALPQRFYRGVYP